MKKIICLLIFTVLNMTICFGSTMFVHEYSTTTSEELRTSLNDCITVKLKLGNLAEENLTLPVYLNSIKEVYNCTTIASIEITGFVITTAGITGYPIKTGEHKFYFGGRILATIQDKDISRTTSTSVYIAPINSTIKPTTVVYLAGWGDDSQRLWDRNRRKIVPAKAGGISVVTGVAIDSSGLPSTSGSAFVAKDILESVGDISEEMNYTFTADVGKINTFEESITKQAIILSDNLAKEGLKDNPKILIGHSQGGLRAFSYAKTHNDVKAIFSVGTPWKGAPVVQHQKDIIEYKQKVLDKVKSLNDKMESYYLGSVNIDKINKALASGIFDTISPSKEQKLADIAKPSAQDMNPKGFFIQNTVQHYTEKTKLVYVKSEKRWALVKATPNVDIPSTPSLKNVIGGAIIGTENNVFNGVMEEYRNEIRNNEEQMELASASLKVIQTTMEMIGGFFISGGAKDLIDRIEEVKKLATRDSINSNMETFFGSKEHDGLIPIDNQKITPNVMNNFIAVDMESSNVPLKVFHVIAKQTSWKDTDELFNDDDAKKQYETTEEAQNRNVRDQLRRWVQVVK